MIKYTKLFLLSAIVSLGFLGSVDAGVVQKIKNARDTAETYTRDFLLQATITGKYLFNKHIVEADTTNYPELVALIQKISKKAGINVPMVVVITTKSYSYADKANAWACGDKNRSIVGVGSWVLKNMTNDELESVLSHEITHIQKDHAFKGYVFWLKAMVPAYCVAALLVRIIDFNVGGINIKLSSTPHPMVAGLTSFGLAYTLAFLPSTWYERKHEKEADLGAVDLNGNKQIVQALEKLETWQKKYVPCSYRLQEAMPWLFSHPSYTQRKKYIQEYTPVPVAA